MRKKASPSFQKVGLPLEERSEEQRGEERSGRQCKRGDRAACQLGEERSGAERIGEIVALVGEERGERSERGADREKRGAREAKR